jgi:hypothetical protein
MTGMLGAAVCTVLGAALALVVVSGAPWRLASGNGPNTSQNVKRSSIARLALGWRRCPKFRQKESD